MRSKKEQDIFRKDIEVPAIVQKKADAAFSKIRMEGTDIMKKTGKNEKKHYHFRSTAAAAACICVLVAGSITAVAAVHHYWSRGMEGNLQATTEQQSELESSGMTAIVNENIDDNAMAVTSGGITVKPLEVIADKYFAYISFSVAGYQLEEQAEPGFGRVMVYTGDDVNDENGYVDMFASFYDGLVTGSDGRPVYDNGDELEYTENGGFVLRYAAEDGTLEYVMMIFGPDINQSLLGKTVHVEFENLGTVYKAEYKNVLNGKWTFDIPLPGNSTAELYTLDAGLGDTGAIVKSVELSPISIKVNYDFQAGTEETAGLDENGNSITASLNTAPPEFCGVRLKDGTLLPYLANGGMEGYSEESPDEYYSLQAFNRVIETSQVDALLFKKLPLNGDAALTEDNLYIVPIHEQAG